MNVRIGELFAGYGGLGMGVQQVYGGDVAWYSEFDPAPSKIMARHHPDAPNHGDITRIDWSAVEPVDILTGGFPCQDVSVAGRRAGMRDGTRSGLWAEMRTAIDQLRPALVVIENVGGLFSATANRIVEPCTYGLGDDGSGGHTVLLRAADAVLGDLATLGYDAEWVALRAADVGAPHGRLRVFITAHPADPRGRGGGGGTPVPIAGDAGEADASPVRADPGPGAPGVPAGVRLLPTPAVNDMGAAYTPDQWDEWTDRMRAEHGNGNGHGKSLSVEVLRMLPTPRVSDMNGGGVHGAAGPDLRTVVGLIPTPSSADALGGHERRGGARGGELLLKGLAKEGHLERFGPYAPAIERWEQVLGRTAPAPTEPGKSRPRLASRFVEWLMGLPDGHVTGIGLTRNQELKALGNGVVPLQAATAIAHLDHLRRSA